MSDELVPAGEFLLYVTEDCRARVECRFQDETIWLSQALIAELFDIDVRTANEHLQNIYSEGELVAGATIRRFRIVRQEGARSVSREIEHYKLDAILTVGYRVRSERGRQFRQWATERLSEYLVEGFTMDDQRPKNPPVAVSSAPDFSTSCSNGFGTSAPARSGCICLDASATNGQPGREAEPTRPDAVSRSVNGYEMACRLQPSSCCFSQKRTQQRT